jgi:hypothetical protein
MILVSDYYHCNSVELNWSVFNVSYKFCVFRENWKILIFLDSLFSNLFWNWNLNCYKWLFSISILILCLSFPSTHKLQIFGFIFCTITSSSFAVFVVSFLNLKFHVRLFIFVTWGPFTWKLYLFSIRKNRNLKLKKIRTNEKYKRVEKWIMMLTTTIEQFLADQMFLVVVCSTRIQSAIGWFVQPIKMHGCSVQISMFLSHENEIGKGFSITYSNCCQSLVWSWENIFLRLRFQKKTWQGLICIQP